ncbi:glycoside hydrolase [Opitutaceae bacterium EW11]|nr:glycoside hydrolase [Opitutaceae bacterium EW11]
MKLIQRSLLCLALALPFGLGFAAEGGSSAHTVANPSGFQVRRGVNLSHWLSQKIPWSDPATFITEKDFQFIRSIGYDHVRVPVDEIELWDENGKQNEKNFAHLTAALHWARKHELRAIVDLHTVRAHHFNAANEGLTNTLWTDPKAQEHFLQLWRDLSSHLKEFPTDWVAYEIMNEPVADKPEQWNALIATSMKLIRSIEPQRVIVIGANRWQTAGNFPYLEVPKDDANIILSVHTYEPMAFTHHTANWVPIRDYEGPVHYPGQTITKAELDKYVPASKATLRKDLVAGGGEHVWNKERIAQELKPAFDRARQLGLQLYCGEFGCLPTVPRKDRLAYYRDMRAVLEENGAAWANWEYMADFGIVPFRSEEEAKTAKPDEGLIEVLLGKN